MIALPPDIKAAFQSPKRKKRDEKGILLSIKDSACEFHIPLLFIASSQNLVKETTKKTTKKLLGVVYKSTYP